MANPSFCRVQTQINDRSFAPHLHLISICPPLLISAQTQATAHMHRARKACEKADEQQNGTEKYTMMVLTITLRTCLIILNTRQRIRYEHLIPDKPDQTYTNIPEQTKTWANESNDINLIAHNLMKRAGATKLAWNIRAVTRRALSVNFPSARWDQGTSGDLMWLLLYFLPLVIS